MKYHVLYASRYSVTDSQSGALVRGTKVTYLDNSTVDTNVTKGRPALTLNCSWEMWDKLSKLPGEYDLEFSARPDSRGRPVLSLSDIKPLSS